MYKNIKKSKPIFSEGKKFELSLEFGYHFYFIWQGILDNIYI